MTLEMQSDITGLYGIELHFRTVSEHHSSDD